MSVRSHDHVRAEAGDLRSAEIAPAAADRALARSPRLYAVVAAIIVAALLGAVYLTSYVLDPLVYDRAAIAQVAQATASGLDYANYDPNVDLRSLPYRQVLGAFNVPALSDRVQQVATAPDRPHATTAAQDALDRSLAARDDAELLEGGQFRSGRRRRLWSAAVPSAVPTWGRRRQASAC